MAWRGSHKSPRPNQWAINLRLVSWGAAWESIKLLRRRAKDSKAPYMTRWLNPQAVNVESVKAMVLNEAALVAIAEWWCPTVDYPKAIPIHLARAEARNVEK